MDTYEGEHWYDLSAPTYTEKYFIDTNGNEYLTSHIGYHWLGNSKTNTDNPIYLLV